MALIINNLKDMIYDIDSTQQRGSKNQEEEESIEKSKHSKINDTLSIVVKNNKHSGQKTGVVEDHVHPLTIHGHIDLSKLASDNIHLSYYEISKKKNKKNYASNNNKSLIQKLILLVINAIGRIKNGVNVSNNLRNAFQTIVSNNDFDNNNNSNDNNLKEKEEEEEEEEKIEIDTKSGSRIIIARNPCSRLEKIIIRDTSSKTSHNNLQEKINSIEIDRFQNSVSLCTEMNLCIKATNINIEANEVMNLKSGSTMTINGSLVKIN